MVKFSPLNKGILQMSVLGFTPNCKTPVGASVAYSPYPSL